MHKYDDRFTKGGCAYWPRKFTAFKRLSSRSIRHSIKIELEVLGTDFIGSWADKRWSGFHWDIWD